MDTIKTGKGNTLLYLQVLRGIASLLVVLMHAGFIFKLVSGGTFLKDAFAFGGAGVDIFFVLSGFIITYSSLHLTSDLRNLPDYLRRRFVRIYPSYWVVFFLFLLLHWFFKNFYSQHNIFQWQELLGSLLLFPGHEMVNGVSWTLTYEVFFYVLFAGFFFVKNRTQFLGILFLYAVLLVLASVFGILDESDHSSWLTLVLFPMNIEFLMGIAVAFLWKRLSISTAKILLVAGIAWFLAGAWMSVQNHVLVPGAFNRVLLFGIPSAFIVIALIALEKGSKVIRLPKWLLALGDASYSVYLIHLPLLAGGVKVLTITGIKNATLLHFLTILLIIAICVAGFLFYRWIERPILARLNKKKTPRLKAVQERQ